MRSKKIVLITIIFVGLILYIIESIRVHNNFNSPTEHKAEVKLEPDTK